MRTVLLSLLLGLFLPFHIALGQSFSDALIDALPSNSPSLPGIQSACDLVMTTDDDGTTPDATIMVNGQEFNREALKQSCENNNRETQVDIIGTIRYLLSLVTGIMASVAGIIALFLFLKHAFMLTTSSGDQGRVEKAQKGMINTAIGLVIISFSYIIIFTVIQTIFNVVGPGAGDTTGELGDIREAEQRQQEERVTPNSTTHNDPLAE